MVCECLCLRLSVLPAAGLSRKAKLKSEILHCIELQSFGYGYCRVTHVIFHSNKFRLTAPQMTLAKPPKKEMG
jgi:hypothetical protein